ncbi:hypothetical protein [Roseibium sediminicola]|uniref:DUF3592 domain-containing protein n=1 Tax=Roseibium sediminicola TaxID=2933272 RepID=A0ABT0GYW9_9HYPH|nr:hypothetical protein [Roseibium sp. CAU 1639]MCK7614634.1 hypothetical protein [Roseibium sp. CAU 1639]
MYSPREAEEDGHALNLAILFFAVLAIVITLYLHHDGALKYWLLDNFGEHTTGTVLSLEDAPDNAGDLQTRKRENPRNYLKNSKAWVHGQRLHIEYKPDGPVPLILTVTLPDDMVGKPVTDTLAVSYLPANPRIAYPTDYLSEFALDSRIALWALAVGAFVLIFGYDAVKAWLGFRRNMHRY